MSKELVCPFCQQELDMDMAGECGCPNEQCQKSVFMFGSQELWQELICTRKALDVAIKYIKHTQKVSPFWFNRLATKTLEQITALEQKDVK